MPITLAALQTISIFTRRHGCFQLRRLVESDVEFLERLALKDIQPTECIQQLLANQLTTPKLTFEQTSELPPSVLIHVVRVWVRKSRIAVGEENASTNTADGIKTAINSYLSLDGGYSRQLDGIAASLESVMKDWNNPPLTVIASLLKSYQNNVFSSLNAFSASIPQIVLPNIVLPEIVLPQLIIPNLINLPPIESLAPSMLMPSLDNLLGDLHQQMSIAATLLDQFNDSWAGNTASIGQSIHQMLDSITQQVAGSWIASGNKWARWFAEVEAAETEFNQSGYGFADFLPISFVMQSTRRDPRTRQALITLQLAAYLRSPEFEYELQLLFAQSKQLMKRRKSVMRGLQAHQQHDYQTSVLTLLREVEGLFKDLLVVMGRAKRKGESYIALENGGVKYDKKGKPVVLAGIYEAVNHAKLDPTARLYSASQTLNSDFRSDRNPTSHGARYDYQSPKLSVQGLLLIRMMAEEFVKIEALV